MERIKHRGGRKRTVSVSPAAILCWTAAALTWDAGRIAGFAAAIIIHEAAHIAVILACKARIERVRVRPAGLEITRGGRMTSYAADAAIALAGPAASLIAGAVFSASGWARDVAVPSVILGTLNALPVRGFDGGDALYALLAARLVPEKAEAAARTVSTVCSAAMWLAAVWLALYTGGNISLLILSAVIFIESAF